VAELYPLFLRLEGRRVLVVGAGSVGARKVRELVDAGAQVFVVAEQALPDVEERAARGEIELARRRFEEADVEGTWLVIAATNDTGVNRTIAAAAEARRVFVNAVDDPPNASAYFAALVKRPPFTIAISSSGQLPALSRLVREIVESALPEQRWIEEARALRAQWRRDGTPMADRFGELVRAFQRSKPETSS
jgi:siroheme synthase-like protein